jgi:hypothetical protein
MKKLISTLAFFGILIITFYCISADADKKAYGKNISMPGEESSYSPDSYTDSARYFPMKIGNRYYYKYKYTFHRSVPDSTAYDSSYYVTRITDTVRFYGKLYYKMNSVISGTQNYFRHDLDSGYLVAYDSSNWCTQTPYELRCYMLSSVLNQIGPGYCWLHNFYCKCVEIHDTNAFNSQRKVKVFSVIWGGTNGGSYTSYLLKDIGMCQYIYTTYNLGPATSTISNYKLIGVFVDGIKYGDTNTIGIKEISNSVPDRYQLYQNYPNPFNPSTNIKYQITNKNSEFSSQNSEVKLIVYNILGKEVATLVNEKQAPGVYEVTFDGSMLPSGIYFYKLSCGDFSEVKKMILIK